MPAPSAPVPSTRPVADAEIDPARARAERDLLARLATGEISGDRLAGELGLTRAAVWKRIDALREAGIRIDAQRGRGYALAHPLDLLDAEAIRAALPPRVRAGLASLDVLWQVESTNAALLALTPPATGARVLLAERQRQGRGRLGRRWVSPLAAHVYLSLDRRFEGGLARLGGLSVVAGIAAAEALRAASGLDIRLKWPNDLWLAGRKLGGLLVEGGGEHGGSARAVVGLGLNVRMHEGAAEGIDQPWTELHAHLDAPPPRNAWVAAVLAAWLPAFDAFERDGLAPFVARWPALDALAGQRIRVKRGDDVVEATALGIDAHGGLRVRDNSGERVLHSGEVSVRPHP